MTQVGQVYQGTSIGICSLVQKELGDTIVATVCGHMESGQVVQGDIVHRSFVLEEMFDTFHVVPLGRHVKWGEPILWQKKTEW